MLDPHELATRQLAGDSFHASVCTPPHAGRINRWRDTLTAPELRLVESVAAPLLTELGYEPAAADGRESWETARRLGLALKFHALYGGRAALAAAGLLPPH